MFNTKVMVPQLCLPWMNGSRKNLYWWKLLHFLITTSFLFLLYYIIICRFFMHLINIKVFIPTINCRVFQRTECGSYVDCIFILKSTGPRDAHSQDDGSSGASSPCHTGLAIGVRSIVWAPKARPAYLPILFRSLCLTVICSLHLVVHLLWIAPFWTSLPPDLRLTLRLIFRLLFGKHCSKCGALP